MSCQENDQRTHLTTRELADGISFVMWESGSRRMRWVALGWLSVGGEEPDRPGSVLRVLFPPLVLTEALLNDFSGHHYLEVEQVPLPELRHP